MMAGQGERAGACRFKWSKAVRRSDVNSTAKTLADTLALDFANSKTGQLNPSRATLARSINKSEATVKRALATLRDAGWLACIDDRTGRNRTASYRLLMPGHAAGNTHTPTANAGQKGPATQKQSGVRSGRNAGQSRNVHIRKKHNIEQKARASDPDVRPDTSGILVGPQSHGERAWERFLEEHGWPSLAELDVRNGVDWVMPFSLPPAPDNDLQIRITEQFLTRAVKRKAKRRGAMQ